MKYDLSYYRWLWGNAMTLARFHGEHIRSGSHDDGGYARNSMARALAGAAWARRQMVLS